MQPFDMRSWASARLFINWDKPSQGQPISHQQQCLLWLIINKAVFPPFLFLRMFVCICRVKTGRLLNPWWATMQGWLWPPTYKCLQPYQATRTTPSLGFFHLNLLEPVASRMEAFLAAFTAKLSF